jgi:hypothetical protein
LKQNLDTVVVAVVVVVVVVAVVNAVVHHVPIECIIKRILCAVTDCQNGNQYRKTRSLFNSLRRISNFDFVLAKL